jgi:3-isopropylmalate/(R)-2-methylmalate dehydratase small subunit
LESDPAAKVTVDLVSQTVTLPDGEQVTFPMDEFAKFCMLEGVDELGYILKQEAAIAAYEAKRPLTVDTVAVS